MSHEPKTKGLDWLVYSLLAFNGSGYADMYNAEEFLDSYIAYKMMRRKYDAVRLARVYRMDVLPIIEDLLTKTAGASRIPSDKNYKKFETFRKQVNIL